MTRYMLIITSNSYQDRDGEFITAKALADYVESCWDANHFVGDNVLLYWHGGAPIGEIVWAGMKGKFLIEVFRERRDAAWYDPDSGVKTTVKAVWDAIEYNSGNTLWRASHGFFSEGWVQDDQAFHEIAKYETSLVPAPFEANPYTYAMLVKS